MRPLLLALTACTAGTDPLIEAHRGAAGYYPQNSRTAMLRSLEDGYDGIELDLVLTADGVPVLAHDPWIHTTLCTRTDGSPIEVRQRIDGLTYAELAREIRCGGVPDPDFPNAEVLAESPMAFDELVDVLYRDRPEVLIHLDLKYEPGWTRTPDAYAEEVLSRWFDADLPQRFYVSSMFPEMILATEAWAARAGRDVDTALSWPAFQRGGSTIGQAIGFELEGTTGTTDAIQAARDARADGLAFQWELARRSEVAAARREGLSTHLWTLEGRGVLDHHTRWPVDTLITDYPGDVP